MGHHSKGVPDLDFTVQKIFHKVKSRWDWQRLCFAKYIKANHQPITYAITTISILLIYLFLKELLFLLLVCLFVCLLAMLSGLQDLSSPTRNWTRTTVVKAQNPNH